MSITKIQYVIFRKIEANNILIGNLLPENQVYSHLQYYPVDLLQFKHGFDYFDHVKNYDRFGIQVLIFGISDIIVGGHWKNLAKLLHSLKRTIVFVFTEECLPELQAVVSLVKQAKFKVWYYSVFAENRRIGLDGETNYFMDVNDFYRLLSRDTKKISKFIGTQIKTYKNVLFKPTIKHHEIEDQFNFKPSVNNVLHIYRSENFPFVNNRIEWQDAPKEGRQQIILNTVEELDDIHKEWGIENGRYDSNVLATLIMIFPFHNPLIKQALKASPFQKITKAIYVEQNPNYFHSTSLGDDVDVEEMKELIEQTANLQISSLDGIGYLHSTFQFSPVLRFPMRSSAVNTNLSFFSLGKKTGIYNRNKRHQAMLKLGENLKDTYLQPELEEYLSNRNGQILFVSDLPIELMTVRNAPLAFVADVCRIQDSNIQGFLNNYSAYSKIDLKIGSRTLSETLLVFSSHKNDRDFFVDCIKMAVEHQKSLGFKIAFAANAEEVGKLIELHQPEILIFDCHCEYDRNVKSCYLKFGENRIYTQDIVDYKIAAPIVYLASCNTNPYYDNVDKLHDAFFQVGALTVTGTSLPIDMLRGTFVYLRMLRLLSSKNERAASGNWLHFICFAIRTSVIWEARQKCRKVLKRDLTKDEEAHFIALLQNLHRFQTRSTVFHRLVSQGLKLSDQITLTLADTHLEFLCYTHYGRPDLIRFID